MAKKDGGGGYNLSLIRSLFSFSTAFFGIYNSKKEQEQQQVAIAQQVENVAGPILSTPLVPDTIEMESEVVCGMRIIKGSPKEPTIIMNSPQQGVLQIRFLGPASSSSPDHHNNPERKGPFWLLSYGNLHMNNDMTMSIMDFSYPVGPSEPVVRKNHILQPPPPKPPTPPPEPVQEKPKSSGTPGGWVPPSKARKLKTQKKKGKR